jgi:hypothetical protein
VHEGLLEARRARRGGSHIDVYFSALNLANLLFRLGELDEARRHGRAALTAAIGALGTDSLQADNARLVLAQIALASGGAAADEAEVLLADVRPGTGSQFDEGLLAMQRQSIEAWRARLNGDLPAATDAIAHARALARTHLGEGNPLAREVEAEGAVIAALTGDAETGLARLRALADDVAAADPSAQLDRGLFLAQLGGVLVELGRTDEAVPVLVEASELLGASWVDSAHADRALELLARAQRSAID